MRNRTEPGARLICRRLPAIVGVVLVAAGLASAMEGTAHGTAELPTELAQAVSAYDRATTSNDIEALDGIVADDYMLVNSDSTVQDKQSYLADFAVPGFKLHPYEIDQPLQKVLGNTALTGGLVKLSWTLDGTRESRLLRIVHVWAERDDQWRLTYTQLTRVPE